MMFEKNYFVLAPSFQGATLLSKLINAHPEISGLGDTYPTNEYDQVCGCKERVSQCDFWQNIKEKTKSDRYQSEQMLPYYLGDKAEMMGKLLWSSYTSFWAKKRILKTLFPEGLKEFRNDYESFLSAAYEGIDKPGKVFVDGCKYVSRVSLLHAADFKVDGIIHLSRDPGDFVMSSMKNNDRSGWFGIMDYSMRYRLYHARVKQLYKDIPHVHLSYEALNEGVDDQLKLLFEFMGVEPLGVEELRKYFDQEWHFMGNSSLFKFDGTFRRSHHDLTDTNKRIVQVFAGNGMGIDN